MVRSWGHGRDHGGGDDGRLSLGCLAFRCLFWGECSTMEARPLGGEALARPFIGRAVGCTDFFRQEKAWACSPGSGVVVKGRVLGKALLPAAGLGRKSSSQRYNLLAEGGCWRVLHTEERVQNLRGRSSRNFEKAKAL